MEEPINFSVEEMLPYFGLSGEASIHQIEGSIPEPDTVDPTDGIRNIRCDQKWDIHVRWNQNGSLIWGLSGTWKIHIYFEKMGVDEFSLMSDSVEVPFVNSDPHTYFRWIPIKSDFKVPPGLYKAAVSLTLVGPTGVALPVAAVGEGPVLQFYKVGP